MISCIQKKHQLIENGGVKYYTFPGMELIHSEMLRLLSIIENIANENGISYWISAGSMIGVIRHHGFIPWDDDLDIDILKKDYIKLVKCLSDYCKNNNDEFLLFPYPQTSHCCNYFASRKYFVRCQGTASIYPVKVDIRPYNCIQNTEQQINENNRLKDIANYKIFGRTHGFISVEDANNIKTDDFFEHYNYMYGTYDPTSTDSILEPPYFEYAVDFEFKYNNIFPLVKEKFENIYVPIPKDYDYILSSLYGDYMKLPQLHHRAPAACEMYKSSISIDSLKSHFCSYNHSRIINMIKSLIFLIRFHGLINFVKYQFFENGVETGSNYEDTRDNW